MERREFLKHAGLGAALMHLGWSSLLHGQEANGKKPNIIFILTDDMGWSDLGCYGSEIRTPNIDKLAREGLRFTQAYNTSKCFPSRACLLTGTYAQQCGMSNGYKRFTNAVTLGEALKTAGYTTLAAGKHHSQESLYERGFDHYYGLRDGCCNFWNPGTQRPGEPEPARKRTRAWCDDEKTMAPFTPEEKSFYTTDAWTDKAMQWLDEPTAKENPFFLYLAYNAPHYPLHAWPEDIARYKDTYAGGYEPIRKARYERQVKMGLIDPKTTPLLDEGLEEAWQKLSAEERAKEQLRMAIYAAMLDRVDQNVGRLLKKLDELGERENTLILFASDNGACAEGTRAKFASKDIKDFGKVNSYEVVGKNWATVQNTPLRYWKNSSHEGGTCTPLIASWPGRVKEPGSFCETPVHFIDVMSTVVPLAGATYPTVRNGEAVTPMQGVDILPALAGRPIQRAQPLFWQWGSGGAVREGDWKAVYRGARPKKILTAGTEPWELYNLRTDRNETKNLAAAHPQKLQALVDGWKAWFQATPAGARL